MNDYIWILVAAVVLDLALAEPPASVHLTVWIGKTISVFETIGLAIHGRFTQFVYGAAVAIFLISAFGWFCFILLNYLSVINVVILVVVSAFVLKPTFCLRESWQLSLAIKTYLDTDDKRIENAAPKIRYLLSTVERDDEADETGSIVSSTIRSLTENASDFLVAPLFYYLFVGVPGALAYRVSNTLDGMIGHRGQYEYLGKFAARFDDVLNFFPARLTGVMFVFAAWMSGLNAGNAWRIMLRDHGNTESPNAGWPMAAAAGALDVQLGRAGHYSLGDAIQPLTSNTIARSVKLFRFMAAIDIVLSIGVLFLLYYLI